MIARRFFVGLPLTALIALMAVSVTSFVGGTASAAEIASNQTNVDRMSGEAAEAEPKSEMRPGFGARIGGYGFRGEDGKSTDCRMNGVGLFGTLDLNKHFFLELGLDSYQSVKGGEDADMDRVSVLTSTAIGFRMFPDFIISPYLQVGTGVEWTRVDIMGQRTSGLYPIGFLGVGGELNITRSLKAGAVLRFLGMAHPNHEDADQSIVYQHPMETKMEFQPVSQAQFYIRYVL